MPKIAFVEHSGTVHEVQAEVGQSVMQVAVSRMVPGILAECGGNCACATCHVYVAEPWRARVNPPSKEERDMFECVLSPNGNSRLGCQVIVTEELDGLIVHLPESQT